VLVFGGAVDRGHKAADLHLLEVGSCGRLAWRRLLPGGDLPPCGGGGGVNGGGEEGWPAARAAHAMEALGGRLYVLGGYGEVRRFLAASWQLLILVLPVLAGAACRLRPQARQSAKPSVWQQGHQQVFHTECFLYPPSNSSLQQVAAAPLLYRLQARQYTGDCWSVSLEVAGGEDGGWVGGLSFGGRGRG
jgi:hypothetical protein